MGRDPRIEQALALIEAAIQAASEEAYNQGRRDALKEIVTAASATMKQLPPLADETRGHKEEEGIEASEAGRKRAPRGSAERVIRRAMEHDKDGNGVSVADIMFFRRGEEEMMLAESSIRGELRRGEKADPPRYVEDSGRWYLLDYGDTAPRGFGAV